MSLRRLAVLFVPVLLGLVSATLPGRAQSPSPRFAFADTTLLRDTLGLTFENLFPVADSLRVTPDTLRALSIRYRAPLWRILRLADSLAVPMDSVSAVMERERFNPLSAVGRHQNAFAYTSTYNIARTSGTWSNTSDWNRISGPLVVKNTTSVTMERDNATNGTSVRQTRDMTTEAGWRVSPDFSVGARAHIYRFDAAALRQGSSDAATTNEFSAPLRLRARPAKDFTTELNLLPGVVELSDLRQVKRGSSAQIDGRARYSRGSAFTGDLSGVLSGNLARTRLPTSPLTLRTEDRRTAMNGTVGLFPNEPLGANLTFRLGQTAVGTPLDSGRVQQLVTRDNGADLTVAGRLDNDRLINVGGHYWNSRRVQNNLLNSVSTGKHIGLTVDGRYTLVGVELTGQFANAFERPEYPQRGPAGGYGQRSHARSIDVDARRTLASGLLLLRAKANVRLTSDRYYVIKSYPTPPVDNDRYDQGYRLELRYTHSEALNSGIALDVHRTLTINIPKEATGSNNEDRRYTAEWQWSYRLFRDLTASQSNAITADYMRYTYQPLASRLALLYRTTTTLAAVLSPRFDFNVSHNVIHQPGGNFTVQPDGLEALTKSDLTKSYQLSGAFSYRPANPVALTIRPAYNAGLRSATQNGVMVPSRSDKGFSFAGGATLNVPIGERARLTGTINRSSSSASSTTYVQGVPKVQPATSQGFWNGSLNLSWTL